MNQALWGALAMACWIAGLFFLRFYRTSRDRIFLFFAVSFWLLTLNWSILAIANPSVETHHYVYGVRLLGFLVIIAGIADKNHTEARPNRDRGPRR